MTALSITLPPNLARLSVSVIILQTQQTTLFSNLDVLQGFRQDVCRHHCSRTIHWIDTSSFAGIPQPVIAQCKVLQATKVLWVLCNRDSRVVIHIKRGGSSSNRLLQLCEQIAKPCNLFTSLDSGNVLCFRTPQSHYGLKLAAPVNSTSSNLHHIATG